MTIELIQSIVRQTTVLIAQLATSGGSRAPLAQVASQVFLDLVGELERQGVSRKVTADMFGLGLRTFQRKIRRITGSSTERGRTLWEAVLDYVQDRGIVTRTEILQRFSRDDDGLVRSVLHDLCDSNLVFQSGQGAHAVYRAVSDDEIGALGQRRSGEGLDELVWAIVYRQGPLTREDLAVVAHLGGPELEHALERLLASGRIERAGDGETATYHAGTLCVPFGSPVGWEAAVFDHFQAMVKTIVCRLREDRAAPNLTDRVGGSTYTLDVWPGHPLEEEAVATLARLRATLGELRKRVEAFNAEHPTPERYTQVVLYAGQCLIPQDVRSTDEAG
jgi:hypothetical protein